MASNFAKLELPFTSRTQTNTDLHLLVQVLNWFDQFYQPTIPYAVWLECRLALAEGFTNVVRHAHSGKPIDTPIELEIKFDQDAIELKIWDSGFGFDLEQQLRRLPAPSNHESAGGRGLKIIQQTADRFSYRAEQQRNCLHIVKHYAACPTSCSAS